MSEAFNDSSAPDAASPGADSGIDQGSAGGQQVDRANPALEGDDTALAGIFNKHKISMAGELPKAPRQPREARTNNAGNTANDDGQQVNDEHDDDGQDAEPAVGEPLTDADQVILGRFQMRGETAKALEAMPAALRAPFIEHLSRTATFVDGKIDQLNRANQTISQLQTQLAKPAAPAGPAPLSDADKKSLEENTLHFGEEAAKAMLAQTQRLRAEFQAQNKPAADTSRDAAMNVLQQRDRRAGFKALEADAPADLKSKLNDPVVRQQILDKAFSLIKSRVQPGMTDADIDNLLAEYGEAEAIPEAARVLFPVDYDKQAAIKLADKARRARRGSPDSHGRPGSTTVKKTAAELEDEAAEASLKRHGLQLRR